MKVLVVIFCLIILTGCAVKSVRCKNCPKKPTTVVAHFEERYCKDLDNIRFKCDRVVFDPVTLPVK